MTRKLLAAATASLVAFGVTVLGGASPAQAGFSLGPPPGYVSPFGMQTAPPESCYVSYFVARFPSGVHPFGGMTECMRVGGVHFAAVQCEDGRILYGNAEEMQDFKQSTVYCPDWAGYGPPTRALYVWGEFHTDW